MNETNRDNIIDLMNENARLRAELRIKSQFIESRQCSDHAGKWERGTCLQCEVERLQAEAAELPGSLRHDTESRDVDVDDTFTRWVKSLPPQYWARYDLTACALGWNAGLDAVRAALDDHDFDAEKVAAKLDEAIELSGGF